jgi:CMP-N,N'-diacetyllegionaminic acid synthase
MNTTKIMALIPARCGSKRVKDKNIRMLGNSPLLVWSIILARACEFENVVLSTDSEEYARIGEGAGASVLMRPPELASDQATDFDVIKHALSVYPADLVVYLRPTTPFRTVRLTLEAIKTINEAGDIASGLRSVEKMPESAYKAFELLPGPFLKEIGSGESDKPNQEVIQTYRGNGYIDIAKASEIQAGRLWGSRCIGFKTPPVIEIDTERDFDYAQWWYKRHSLKEEFTV